MIDARSSIQEAASGWPPVAHKNLRTCPSPGTSLKQESRRVAAHRRSADGTCEKPPTDRISLSRCSPEQFVTAPVPAAAAAARVPLLSRQTVHLQTGAYMCGSWKIGCGSYVLGSRHTVSRPNLPTVHLQHHPSSGGQRSASQHTSKPRAREMTAHHGVAVGTVLIYCFRPVTIATRRSRSTRLIEFWLRSD